MINNVMYSKKTDNWKTPTNIYNRYMKAGYIDCFPYQAEYNEFEKDYYNSKLFINPPFSKMNKVAEWVLKQKNNRNIIALLIPARTDTKWFHELIKENPMIYFIKGRLKYNDTGNAPFPTILMVFEKTFKHLQLYVGIKKEFYD